MTETDNRALQILLDQRTQVGTELPEKLIIDTYHLERTHQYDRDSDVIIGALRRIIDEHLDLAPGDDVSPTSRTRG